MAVVTLPLQTQAPMGQQLRCADRRDIANRDGESEKYPDCRPVHDPENQAAQYPHCKKTYVLHAPRLALQCCIPVRIR